MDIVESGPHRLVLRTKRNFVVLGSLAAAGAFLIALLIVWVGGRLATVECVRRATGGLACHTREAVLGLVVVERRHFEEVRAATVEEVFGDDADTYYVELETGNGARRVSNIHSTRMQCAAFARRFNDFVHGDAGTASFIQEPSLVVVPFIPLMLVVAFAAFQISRPRTVELDAALAVLTIRGPFKRVQAHLLDKGDNLILDERTRDSEPYTVVCLRRRAGETIDLNVPSDLMDLMKGYLPRHRP